MVFTHLHVASGYSVRYGASLPQQLVDRAAERGLGALALTDRDTLSGAVRFAKACAKAGVRPVFGADLAVSPIQAPARPAPRGKTPVRGGAFIDESAPRVTLLARDRTGWAALCRLVSAAHAHRAAHGGQVLVPWEQLCADAEGLVVLLGPASEPVRALSAGRPDRAEVLLDRWREVFGPRLRMEAVHLGRTGTGPGSLRLAARTVGFAAEQDVACVLANAVRYADAGQARVADVLDSARLLVPVNPATVDNGQRWLKDAPAMGRLAKEVARAAGQERSGAARLLAATEGVAQECRVDPVADLGLGRVHFPEEHLIGAGPGTTDRVLRERCQAAMVTKGYDRSRAMHDRLEDELRVIKTLGWSTYFLTVARVVDDTRDLGIRVAARGSGAGSLVNHLLGIATANPLDHELIMERFLNLRRKSLPDIDIDVESARRLEVYRAIFKRFGAERVATVSMPETYRVRHAIRDVGAALGMDPDEVGRIAKSFPHIRARDARTALAELPELQPLAQHAERYGALWELVEGLDALPRGIAMHPCAVLLSDATLLQRTPVMPTAGEGFPMSQFDKDDVEDLGLLKLDVLGVRMQSAMAYAVAEVERTTGHAINLDSSAEVPFDDPAAFELLRAGESLGCFQVESPGQRDLLGRLQPSTFDDLIAEISLFRPGPVAADMVRPFIEARHGRRRPHYPHPDLIPALRSTHGVVVFNEQVIKVVSVMTRTDLAMGEEARRALSDPDRLPALEAWFRGRAADAGYTPAVINEVWEILRAMGAYGFAKAHAVAFAVPTLQSTWLKAHHPAAFYAGLLTHDPGMYPQRLILADARRRGVAILPLDVQHSGIDYRTEALPGPDNGSGSRLGLRMALKDVHGISHDQAERIVAGQPYTSVPDWWTRAHPTLPVAQRLARVGALDCLAPGAHRREILLQVDELHHQHTATANPAQLTLTTDPAPPTSTGLPVMSAGEKLEAELAVIGMDASRHMMEPHHPLLAELGVTPALQLREMPTGETVLVAGAKVAIQTPPNRTKRRIIFATLDDGSGGQPIDLAFFDDSHQACAHVMFHSWLIVVRGTVQRRGKNSMSVVGSRAWDLTALAAAHQDGGTAAVRRLLAAEPPTQEPETAQPSAEHEQGGPTRRMWHASQGSAG
ncbi:DNA polymerase III subunit alpha [Streptomyces olivoreticuli]